MNSFLPSTVKLWNALPNEMEQNPSISNLKHFLSTKSLRRKIPHLSHWQSQRTHFAYKCSLLDANQHSHNIAKSPNCLCTESTKHYFIRCPLNPIPKCYASQQHILLFGDPNLSIQENIKNSLYNVQAISISMVFIMNTFLLLLPFFSISMHYIYVASYCVCICFFSSNNRLISLFVFSPVY